MSFWNIWNKRKATPRTVDPDEERRRFDAIMVGLLAEEVRLAEAGKSKHDLALLKEAQQMIDHQNSPEFHEFMTNLAAELNAEAEAEAGKRELAAIAANPAGYDYETTIKVIEREARALGIEPPPRPKKRSQ
jgi:hypothetical protein